MTRDKNYWEDFYKKLNVSTQPSSFAQFLAEKYIRRGMQICELGCGNGRDSLFFASLGCDVIAYDQCEEEIKRLKAENSLKNISFFAGDFTDIHTETLSDLIYSRFTMHAINKKAEDNLLANLSFLLKENGLFCIEARGLHNELYALGAPVEGEADAFIYNDHYRRFIDPEVLSAKLKRIGFKILFCSEKKGYAPLADEDQIFFRLIAVKE